ncbi:MAG: EAL domain-containing protein [Firmicutes bacterium]|nr:EAL domain-containing protein [Bacillota bacterium]
MPKWRFGRIRDRVLVLFVALVFVLTLAVMIMTGVLTNTLVNDLVEENALNLARHQSRLIALWQQERIADLEQLANSALIESLDWDSIEPYLQRQILEAPDYYLIFFVATPDGSYNTTSQRNAGSIADRSYFPHALAGKTVISEPLVSRSTDQRVFIIATPIWNEDNSAVKGVLGLSVDLEKLFDSSHELMIFDSQDSVYLLDENGYFILHHQPEMIMNRRIHDVYPQWDDLPRESGSFSLTQDGVTYRAFYEKLQGPSGWTVAVKVPESYFTQPAKRLILHLFGLSIVCFGLVLWLGSWFSATITEPIVELNQIFKRGAAGELTVRAEVVSTDEIGETREAFNRMMDTIGSITYYDPLTGLPNRQHFMDQLTTALKDNSTVILALVTIREFSEIKAFLGPEVTDRILIHVAERLQEISDQSLVTARLSEAEFGIIIPSGASAVFRAIDRLDDLLTHPIEFRDDELTVRLFGGISISDDQEVNVNTFYQQAQTALYEAEHNSDEPLKLYSPTMHHTLLERLRFQTEIRSALEQDQFVVYYQPVVDLKNQCIAGKEALVRWKHPTRGILAPDQFLQAVEQGGFMEELSEFVLDQVCAQHEEWINQGFDPGWVAVNISANHFRSPRFTELIRSVLDGYEIPSNILRLEITEDAMLAPTTDVLNNFQELRQMGIRMAIDDFGTAYSSLEYLVRYPMETLKIDQTFIAAVDQDSRIQGLVKSMVGMGANLSMTIVAEGVERKEQLSLLDDMGCDEAQGYLFSRPIPWNRYKQAITELNERLGNNEFKVKIS